MSERKERLFWPDFIRAIACICILIIHFNAEVSHGFLLENKILVNNFLDMYLGTIGVNLFFMISGAMLFYGRMGKEQESIFQFWRRRFIAIYPMYWIAFGFAILISFWVFRQMPKDGIWWMINSILGFDGYFYVLGITPFAFYQLGEWFLGCIICLYIMAPLLLIAIDKYGLWKVSGVSILIWGGYYQNCQINCL